MRTSSVALGFRRLLLLIGLFALLLGVAPLAPPAPSVSAQDSGWYEDIGDPPARSDAYIPNEESDGFSLAAVPATVDINSRNAVRTFFNNHFRHSMPLVGWTGNFNGCAAGTQSAAFRQAVLDQLTWYRAMAGVPANVSLSSTFNSYAQAAALIMGANEYITHFPPSNAKCYTGTGYTAAGHSNLHIFAAGRFPDEPASEADPFPNGHDPVTGYMEDTGGNNLAVGHRRWLLYPQTTTFGTGDVAGVHPDSFVYTNAIWVQDNIDGARPATRTPYVAWPPAGYVPYQVVFSRWSFSYPGADFSSASVNVSRNGTTITAPIDDRATYGVGENSIVFRPEALGDGAAWPPPLNGDNTYRVTINNVRIGGAARSFTYDVIVFNPATEDSGGTATVTLGANSGNIDETISFSLKSFPKGQKVNVEWRDLGTGKTLLKTVTANSSSGNYNGSFVVPPGPGDLHMVTFTSGSVIKQAFFFVNIEVGFESEYVAGGVEVRWTIRGLGANESFQAIWLKILDQGGFLMQLPTPLTFEDLTADANGTSSYTFLFPSWVETGPQIIGVLTADGDFGGDVLTVLANPPEAIPLVEGSGTNAFLSADTYFTDVELDGRDSTPSAGASITSYEWSVNGAVIATGANPTVGLPVGEHEVILTIVDSHGLRTSGSVYAFIDVEYGSVLAYAGENRTISTLSAPATVQLDGSASIVDEFHTIAGYAWYIQGQATPFSTLAQPTVSLGLGTTTIELRVTNNTGDVGTTSVAITVALGPVANAGADRTVDTYGTSASVTLNGSGSSAQPGRSISSYSWSRNGSPIATGVSPTVTLPVGTHTVSLTVTDNTGATGTDDVVVTVTQIPPAAATIGAADGTVGAEISYNLTNFPKNAVVTLSFVSNDNKTDALGTVTTDGNGAASGTITVPARPGGSGSKIVFTSGPATVQASFEIKPRISSSPATAAPGQQVSINLRGFARNDPVKIYWLLGSGRVLVASVTTSGTGSTSNLLVTVPANATGGVNKIRVEGTINQQSSAVTIVAPAVELSTQRTTVNSMVTATITNFPANSPVTVSWRRQDGTILPNPNPVLPTFQTDATGSVTGKFKVPANTGGTGHQVVFSAGGVSRSVAFEIAPRVKVTPAPAARGQTIDISLRGFARQEAIRIRWRLEGTSTWIVLATGTTSNTGSANIKIPVPGYAADGTYQLRAETTSFNQQTNVVEIEGGVPVQPAEAPAVTPEITPVTIDRTALPLDAPIETIVITDEARTPELKRLLTDGELTTGWSGAPDPIRHDARLTIDLGETHALRGFGWLTETGGCGKLTGLEYSLDGETWTAVDPYLQPGTIGEGMAWRYQAIGEEARYLRFTFAPENPEQTSVGCLAEVAVWGTRIEPAVVETPVPTEPAIEETPVPTEPVIEEPTVETTVEAPVAPTEEPTPESEGEE